MLLSILSITRALIRVATYLHIRNLRAAVDRSYERENKTFRKTDLALTIAVRARQTADQADKDHKRAVNDEAAVVRVESATREAIRVEAATLDRTAKL
jgi:hypothetical protein